MGSGLLLVSPFLDFFVHGINPVPVWAHLTIILPATKYYGRRHIRCIVGQRNRALTFLPLFRKVSLRVCTLFPPPWLAL